MKMISKVSKGKTSGFGLVEAVILVAVVGILGVVLTKMSANSVQSQTHMKFKNEKVNLSRDLLYLLRARDQCEANFRDVVVSSATPATTPTKDTLVYQDAGGVNNDFVGDTPGSPPTKENNIYNIVLKITELRLVGPFRRNATAGPGQYRGNMDLVVKVQSKIKANANSDLQIKIPIAVDLRTDGSNRIFTCVAIGNDEESPWAVMPDGTLLYNSAQPIYLGPNSTYNVLNPPDNPKLFVSTNLPLAGPPVANILATGFLHHSDERLKSEVQTHDRTNELLALSGYDFRWRGTKKKDLGILAQELAHDFPELVGKGQDDHLTVNSLSLVASLIESTKDLELRIQKQKRRQKRMREKLRELEASL